MIIILAICFLGCKQKETNDNVVLINKNNIISKQDNMDKYLEILKKNGFKFPSKEIYDSKIKDLFGLEVKNNIENEKIKIIPKGKMLDESTFFPEAIISNKYIYWNQDEEWNDLAFVNLNKYIFYNDKAALTYLKINDSNGYLIYLVQYFGYMKDQHLLDYVFKKIDGNLSNSFSFAIFFGRNGVNGTFALRKELLDEYLTYNSNVDIPEIVLIPYIIDKKNENYMLDYDGNRKADAAFILEKILEQMIRKKETLISGSVDYILKEYPSLFSDLKDHKAYNYHLLNNYINETFEIDE